MSDPLSDPRVTGANIDSAAGRVARHRLRIAWMYYREGLTQQEIADRLGVGRITVVRNIQEAQKRREVQILIQGEAAECVALEADLKSTFGLDHAVVVPEPANEALVAKAIGLATGQFVSERLRDGLAIGVGWGTTLQEMLHTLAHRDFAQSSVVSLLGGIVAARHFNPMEFAWVFARTIGAGCHMLTAPVIVDSPATKRALVERCGLSDVLERAYGVDIALMSVGTMAQTSTAFQLGFLNEADRMALKAAGAVGDMLYNFYDAEGRLVDHPHNSRVMSVEIARLRSVPLRILASGGADKIEAVHGGMKLMACNALVINEASARDLLAKERVEATGRKRPLPLGTGIR